MALSQGPQDKIYRFLVTQTFQRIDLRSVVEQEFTVEMPEVLPAAKVSQIARCISTWLYSYRGESLLISSSERLKLGMNTCIK